MSENNVYALGFEDEIEDQSYALLEPGEYEFTITAAERGYHDPKPGSKLPPNCPKVKLKLQINAGNGMTTTVENTIFLASNCVGIISAFYECIGMMKKGDKLKMNWNVVGKSGICKINHREYNGNTYNNFDGWVAPKKVAQAPATLWNAGNF